MPYALFSMLWTSVLAMAFTAAVGMGFFVQASGLLRYHVILALTATFLSLFAHCMTMFYFIGSGKKIKDFISDWDPTYRERIRAQIIDQKRKIFPGMLMVCIAIMAAFILGGASDAKVVSPQVHAWTSYIALFLHVHTSTRESFHIFKNISLIQEINLEARRRAGFQVPLESEA